MAAATALLMTNSIAMGGMEEHVRLLAQHLDRSRYEVHAVVPDWEAVEPFATSMSVAADELTRIAPDRRYSVVRQFRDTIALWRLARRERFAVAHLHSTGYQGLVVAIAALRLAGVRSIVMTEHLAPDAPVSALERRGRSLVTRAISALVCVSENNRVSRERHLGVAPCATFVVNNGIDPERFLPPPTATTLAALRSELGIDPGRPVVGTAIRLEPDKGVSDLIDAFAIVLERQPDAVLLIVGDGSQRNDLEAQTARLGIADSVRFVGFHIDPTVHIHVMDVFVLPVPFGSGSIGLLEAMAMERPCIITFGGRLEAVQHGESGFCADPRSPASIAKYISELLDDRERRERIGRAALERVRNDYSARRVADELADIYDQVRR